MTTPQSIEEFERRVGLRPDVDFRLSNVGAVAVFASPDRRDAERARLARSNDTARYFEADTPAAIELASLAPLQKDRQRLELLIESRVAMAARGKVEVYCMNMGDKSSFQEYVLDSVLRNDAITHINGVPRDLVQRGNSEQQARNLRATELVRDHRAGRIKSLEQPGDYYIGGSGPSMPALRPPQAAPRVPDEIVKIARQFDEIMKAREGAVRLAAERAARARERGRDGGGRDGR